MLLSFLSNRHLIQEERNYTEARVKGGEGVRILELSITSVICLML